MGKPNKFDYFLPCPAILGGGGEAALRRALVLCVKSAPALQSNIRLLKSTLYDTARTSVSSIKRKCCITKQSTILLSGGKIGPY